MDSERQTEETPSLDRKTYYSADSGFAAAAAGRAIAVAVQDHIDVIVRNEELEIASTHNQFREKIESLENEKKELEKDKDECQKEIRTRELEVAEQEATLNAECGRF